MTTIGEWTPTADVNPKIQNEVLNPVQNAFNDQARYGQDGLFDGISFRQKVLMGGTSYIIKVHIAEAEDGYAHLFINQITGTEEPTGPSLRDFQLNQTLNDALEPRQV